MTLQNIASMIVRHRIVPAWMLWVSAMMLNALIDVIIQKHVANYKIPTGIVLYDLGFEFLPYIPSKSLGFSLPDLCALVSATLIAVNLNIAFPPKFSVILLRRMLCISAFAYLGRAVSVPLTLLPNPDLDCVPKFYHDSVILSTLLVPFGKAITCTDVFYSGHAIPITCAILLWKDYMCHNFFRPLGLFVSCIALLGLISTHFHYTVDVVYGFCITWIFWRGYHLILQCPSLLANASLIRWFEHDPEYTSVNSFGIIPIDFSSDPRITWMLISARKVQMKKNFISQTQLIILLIIALCLSPSWFALFNS